MSGDEKIDDISPVVYFYDHSARNFIGTGDSSRTGKVSRQIPVVALTDRQARRDTNC